MAQVFISYAAEDRARVESLVRTIESSGLTVWWDRRIGMGSSFDVVIERELDAASCVVVVWSSHSVASEWVRSEANEGAERGILVPVLIDDVRPPLAFRRTQAALLRGWPLGPHDETLRELVRSVGDVVAKQSHEVVQAPPSVAASEQIVVAVLPLADRSPERNMAYLCEGLAEDLMNALFSVGGLRVLAATDTFPFKDSSSGIAEIGASLGATVVLEGSVQRAGERLAISTRLIEVAKGLTIYSERWVRSNDDVFDLQAEIATRVVDGLRTRLGLAGIVRPQANSRITDPAAYDLYKHAMTESPNESGGASEMRRAVLLEFTIALDPHFARAHTDLVSTYRVMSSDVDIGAGAFARSEALLAQLESNNPGDPACWDIQVQQEQNMAALADQCEAAIRKGHRVHAYPHPTGLLDVRSAYARALAHSGLPRGALGYFALVDREGEPNLADTRLAMCGCLIACSEFERAIKLCDRIRESPTANLTAAAWEVAARVALHDLDGAAAVPVPYMSDYRSFAEPLIAAKRDPAHHVGDEESNKSDALDMRGYCLLALGETERGLDHLERAVTAHGADFHWMAFRLPIFRPLFATDLSRHPRYQAILAALKIDAVSRERMRAQAAALTPITGVDVGPLLDL